MSYKNLAEINYVDGILKLLQNNKLQVAILVITLDTTPDNIKIYMRRWLKNKSKEFPNILFLYFCANSNDIKESNLSLISKNINGYPYVYHILNAKKILVEVENANIETIKQTGSKAISTFTS
jgi:hypothetical protein